MATVKPPSPQRPLMQTNMKPPSPLQPKHSPKTPISHPQRRWRFQTHTDTSEQRRQWFQTTGLPGRQGLAGLRDDAPSHTSATRRRRCGGNRRVRRARAGFEIDHSERSSRVAISRAAGPDGARNTSGAASNKLNRKLRLHRRCEGRKRARLRCPWAAAGPGRASRRRTQPHASDTSPPAWRAPEGPEGQAAAAVGGGAWPRCRWVAAGPGRASRSTTPSRQARVWRSRGRAAAHRHTQRPGPTKQRKTAARHSKRGRHQPTPCASALTHP